MKKILVLLAAGAGIATLVQKRKQQAAAERALWDEATKTTPVTNPYSSGAATTPAPAVSSPPLTN